MEKKLHGNILIVVLVKNILVAMHHRLQDRSAGTKEETERKKERRLPVHSTQHTVVKEET